MTGQVLHYRILGKLGQGGMGVVYEAEDLKLSRRVALKFLSPEISRQPEARERFHTEARAASALNHPNICTIHAVEEVPALPEEVETGVAGADDSVRTDPRGEASEDSPTLPLSEKPAPPPSPWHGGATFIVMEYVRGTPLSVRIARTPLDSAAGIDVAFQISRGLAEAHAHGIVHRDIKPSNVMVTESGLVKIMDFGLATIDGTEHGAEDGTAMGTLAYMSPEQIRQQAVDHRTDIYSLGVLLYEVVTGKKPFSSKSRGGLVHAIASSDPPPPSEFAPGVPRGFERLVLRCLQKDPDRRYATCRELIAEFEALRLQAAEAALEKAGAHEEDGSSGRRESERRQATVMFGEIRSHGGGSEALESSDVLYAVDEVTGRLAGLTARWGGTVDRAVGGDFTVIFGLTAAAESTPRRAVQTALAIRSAVERANDRLPHGFRLAVRAGINTGPVLAVSVEGGGASTYSVLGDTVVLASRLKERALDGQICVGPSTHRQTSKEFEFAALFPIALPGRQEPVPAFEFLRERTADEAGGTSGARMVGRERELERLQQCILSLLEGSGGIVSLVGEPGIGKSRLLQELARWESARKVLPLVGRALSTGQNLAYHPLVDLLKRWARIREDDTKGEVARKLEHAVRDVSPAALEEVFPFVATLMGVSLSGSYADRLKGIEGEALGRLVLKGLRELVEKISEKMPLLFVIEDLHWADLSSIELLEGLMRSARNHRVLFVYTFRPNYAATSDRLQETIRDRHSAVYTEIVLKPLEPEDARRLIGSLLDVPGLPSALEESIVKRADGNPLFVEEVVRSLIAEGAVVAADGGWRVTDKIESVVIPDTLQELLMARLDLLDEGTRSVLKVAAVIGRHFFRKVLATVAASPETLEKRLDRLVEIQLLAKAERLGEVEYLFRHALVQEAVYECIPTPKRKELHLEVARALETVFADRLDEVAGRLAFHFSSADDPQKAEEYLVRAGEQAVKAAAPSEALFYFQEGLALYLKRYGATADPERRARLEKSIGLAFHNKGRMIEAVRHLDRALECWGEAPPRGTVRPLLRLASDLASILTRLYVTRRNPSRVPGPRDNDVIDVLQKKGTALVAFDARRYFLESVGVLRRMNRFDLTRVTNGPAFYAATSALFSVPGLSFRISRKILDHVRPFVKANDPRTVLYYRFVENLHNLLEGAWTSSEPYDESLVEANRKLGEVWFASVYVFFFGLLETEHGRYARAETYADEMAEMGDVYENDLIRARMEVLRARLSLKRRALEAARAAATKAAALFSKIDQALLVVHAVGLKAQAELLSGSRADAQASLDRAAELIAAKGTVPPYYASPYDVARLRASLDALDASPRDGRGRAQAGQVAAALDDARRALKMARRNAMDRVEILRLSGSVNWAAGHREKALHLYGESTREGERLGTGPEVARTHLEAARRLLGPASSRGDATRAREPLRKAQELFQEAGLVREKEEAERLSALP